MDAAASGTKIRRLWYSFQNKPLAFKISALFVILFAILMTINSFVITRMRREESMNLIREVTYQSNSQLAGYFDKTFTLMVEEMLLLNQQFSEVSADEPGGALTAQQSIFMNNYINAVNMKNNNFQYIHSIFILRRSRQSFIYHRNGWNLTRLGVNFEDVSKSGGTAYTHWTGVISTSAYFTGDSKEVVSFISPFFPSGSRENITILNLSAESIAAYLASQLAGSVEGILIDCGDGTFITSGPGAERLLEHPDFCAAMTKNYSHSATTIYQNYAISSKPIVSTGWTITTVNDLTTSQMTLSSFLGTMIMTLLLLLLLLTILIYFFIRTITKPLQKLSGIMARVVAESDFTTRFRAQYTDEIGTLATGFNTMMDRIVALTEQISLNEEERHRAEIKLMQMQIKPHFLYNALETARFLVELGDEKASEIVGAVAQFYKLSLSGVADITTVREETEHLEHYLKIQGIRYASSFAYVIEIDDGILDESIVKFTLQPIVENAIYHGLKPKMTYGLLSIRGFQQGEDIIFTIHDDGVGMDEAQLAALKERMNTPNPHSTERVGLYNVNRRLVLYYGAEYSLSYESVRGSHTKCIVRIPAAAVNRGALHV